MHEAGAELPDHRSRSANLETGEDITLTTAPLAGEGGGGGWHVCLPVLSSVYSQVAQCTAPMHRPASQHIQSCTSGDTATHGWMEESDAAPGPV